MRPFCRCLLPPERQLKGFLQPHQRTFAPSLRFLFARSAVACCVDEPQRGRLRPRQQLSATGDTVNLEGLHAFQARRPVPFRYCRANPCPLRRHWPSRYIHQVGVRHESKLEVYNSEWCRLRVGRNLGRIRLAKHATRGSDVKHTEILSTTSQSSRCTIRHGAASAWVAI